MQKRDTFRRYTYISHNARCATNTTGQHSKKEKVKMKEDNYQCCKWNLAEKDKPYYETACGSTHQFNEGNIVDNDFEYCPYCGRRILEYE